MNTSLTVDSSLFIAIVFLFQFLTKKSSNSTVVGTINATMECYSSNTLLERCIKMNKIKYRFKLLIKLVWKVINFCVFMNWDFVKICEDLKIKQGQLLSILTKIRYSHGQQSLLVGKCLRENHRQIKSCLPHLPANRKKSGDFAESQKQVTSSCFKWQKRPQ